ncbi:choice-of-anchor B family protein [Rubrivirga sp.]|uniref:choice-of-anchor B family protein n=1 Tax=Rubrivirga sp. TaxID=1885344 RepID=UPI003B52DC7A
MTLRSVLVALALVAAPAPQAQDARAECLNGVAALPDVGAFPCSRVDLVGYLSVASFATPGSPAATGHNDIWGWTDPETGVEYALVGTYNGTGFVDLSDPQFPRVVGKLPSSNERTPVWRDIKVYRDHAFIVADNARDHGMQVFDLTRLRGVTGDAVTFEPDTVYTGIRSAHNVVIDEETGFAYAVGFRYPEGKRAELGLPAACDAPGFHAVDIRDPKNPTFAACFSDAAVDPSPVSSPGYTHDAQCVVYRGPDADYQGRELCFAANEDVVTVFDVTDKAAVSIITQASYPLPAYTHQGWLTEDHRFFLADDELDELNGLVATQRTIVLDFADLDDPEVSFVYDSGNRSIDHNQYVRGRYSFQSNYETGLRIVDLSQIADGTMTEAAFFDTFPPSDRVSFDGQWSNYPYFGSGLVVANDDTFGLFVLRPAASLDVDRIDGPALPEGYSLSPPRPNPTAVGARLALRVDRAQAVRADLFDVAGRRVAAVYEGPAGPGAEVVLAVSGDGLPAGVYVVRVVGETFEASRRVVLTR